MILLAIENDRIEGLLKQTVNSKTLSALFISVLYENVLGCML